MKPRSNPSEILIERAVSAHRELSATGRVLSSPAWWDLTPEQRASLFDEQMVSRFIEAAIDSRGLTMTAKAVLNRTALMPQLHGGE